MAPFALGLVPGPRVPSVVLEIDVERLRGKPLQVSLVGFAASFGLCLLIGGGLAAAAVIDDTLLVAIILCATSTRSSRAAPR